MNSSQPPANPSKTDPFWGTDSGKATISIIVIVVVGVIIFIAVWFGLKAAQGNGGNTNITFNLTSPVITAGGVQSVSATFTLDDGTKAAVINFPTTLVPIGNTFNAFGLVAPAGNNTFPSSMAPASGSVMGTTSVVISSSSSSTSSSSSSAGVPFTVFLYADGTLFLLPTDNTTAFGPSTGLEVTINAFTLSYTATSTPVTLTYGNVPNFFFNAPFFTQASGTTLFYSTNPANDHVFMVFPSLGINTSGTAGSSATSDTVLPNSPTKLIPANTVTNNLENAYDGGHSVTDSVSIDSHGNVTLTNTAGNFMINQTGSSFGCGLLSYSLV